MEDNSMCVQNSANIAAYRQISDSCCEMSTSPEGISVFLFFCFCFVFLCVFLVFPRRHMFYLP